MLSKSDRGETPVLHIKVTEPEFSLQEELMLVDHSPALMMS